MIMVVTAGFLAGVDVSPAMVARGAARYRSLIAAKKLELRCAPAEALPYPSGDFTKVCTVNSIFYWDNTPQAISELWRVLEDNGLLVMCLTCKESLEEKEFTRHGIALYEADEICRMIQSAGFREIDMTRSSDRHREFLCVTGRK
jgi:ubiquinone/menaquinone biosynthesis C-methylase UbiE